MYQKNSPIYSLFTLVILIILLASAGCSDSIMEADPSARPSPQSKVPSNFGLSLVERIRSTSDKARHFHLLKRAIISAPTRNGRLPIGKTAASDSVRLMMGFSDGSEPADSILKKIAGGFKIFNRYTYTSSIRGSAVTVAEKDLESFSANADTVSDVEWFEPDPDEAVGSDTTTTTTTAGQQMPWSMADIGADTSWTVSGDGQGKVTGVDLYVVDTGARHEDLNVVECLELSRGTLNACSDLSDPNGHGTQAAGAAAAVDDSTGIVGVAPGVDVRVVQALNNGGKIVLGRLLAVVDYITKQKNANPSRPIVVNMSLGSDVNTSSYNGLDQAIQASIEAGVVYVFAAGNSGINAETVTPAHVSEGITVGAYDQNRQFSVFSNYGSVLDILAPGEDVLTLAADSDVGRVSGTSVAAPHVAGAAALLLAEDPSLTPAQVRDLIISTSRTGIGGLPSGTTDRSLYVGQ